MISKKSVDEMEVRAKAGHLVLQIDRILRSKSPGSTAIDEVLGTVDIGFLIHVDDETQKDCLTSSQPAAIRAAFKHQMVAFLERFRADLEAIYERGGDVDG